MGRPADAKTRRAVEAALQDPSDTRSRAQMARDYGVAPRTITRWARELGIPPDERFSTSSIAAATKAAADRRRAKRAALVDKMLDEADALLDRLRQPWLVWSFGGKDNIYNEHVLPEPPVEAVRNALTTAAIALDKSVVVDRHDNAGNDDDAAALLADLGATLADYAARTAGQRSDDGPDGEHGEREGK